MRRVFTTIAAICALLSGAALMQLKLAVQDQAEKVVELADQIHKDQESIRILEAEWAYLTSPQALQEQSIEFLALMPPSPKQVLESVADIPMRRAKEPVSGDDTVLLPTSKEVEAKKTNQSDDKDSTL